MPSGRPVLKVTQVESTIPIPSNAVEFQNNEEDLDLINEVICMK